MCPSREQARANDCRMVSGGLGTRGRCPDGWVVEKVGWKEGGPEDGSAGAIGRFEVRCRVIE